MSRQTKRVQVTCRCSAYSFPHRRHSGKCVSCRHNKNWLGVHFYLSLIEGEWCEQCAQDEVESNGGNWREFLSEQFI